MISTVNDYGCGVIALLNVSGHIVLLSRDLWRRCNRFLKKEKSSPASPKKSYALNTRLHPPVQAVSLPFLFGLISSVKIHAVSQLCMVALESAQECSMSCVFSTAQGSP